MKKATPLHLLFAVALITICTSYSPIDHGVYAQLTGNKKFVVQIVPDKTYANVVVHVNFYSADNKRVGQKAYSLTDKDKYVRKDLVTNKVFKFTFDDVSRVKIDHVNQDEILGEKEGESKGGVKISLPITDHALGPIEK